MAPFLSICVMTYRRREILHKTLDSLVGQLAGYPEVEVVVCDNASGDGTRELVATYLPRHPQLRYHCNEHNVGFDGNVVTCIHQSAGEYIAFFSDDDIAPPGHVEFLLSTLREKRPAVLYFNHRPFFHNDVTQLGEPASPQIDMDSEGDDEFLLIAGLGFLSSLVVPRAAALTFLGKVIDGGGAAHVDIAARIVMSRMGPCLYRGSHSVHARYDYGAGSILIGGCVNLAKLYRSLVTEGLLSPEANSKLLRLQIRHLVPRKVAAARGQGKGEYPLRGMKEIYGSIPSFYFLVLPLYLIPRPIMALTYRTGRWMLQTWRLLSVRKRSSP